MNPTVVLVEVTLAGLESLRDRLELASFFADRAAVPVFPVGAWEGVVPPEASSLSRVFALVPVVGETVDEVLEALSAFRATSEVGAAWPQPPMGMQPAAPPTQQGYLYGPRQGITSNPNHTPHPSVATNAALRPIRSAMA